VLVVALGLAGTGCGGKDRPVKVEGTVTLNGKPVDSAMVLFHPVDGLGHAATGFTDSDGVYHLTTYIPRDGALPGEYKIVVRREKGKVEWPPEGLEAMNPENKGKAPPVDGGFYKKSRMMPPRRKVDWFALPEVYGKEASTPLRCHVPPDGRVDLELSSKGGS
jgi:hypothetical protein